MSAETLSWENAAHAHGPKLVTWINTFLKSQGLEVTGERVKGPEPRYYERTRMPSVRGQADYAWSERLQRWKNGTNPTFFSVDAALTQLGVHVSELPDEVWND